MSDAIPIATLRETYPDEWVTAKVSSVDDANLPVAGGPRASSRRGDRL